MSEIVFAVELEERLEVRQGTKSEIGRGGRGLVNAGGEGVGAQDGLVVVVGSRDGRQARKVGGGRRGGSDSQVARVAEVGLGLVVG